MKSILFAITLLVLSSPSYSAIINQLNNQHDFFQNYNVINFDEASNGAAANTLYIDEGVLFSNISSSPVPIYEWSTIPNYNTGEDYRFTSSPNNVIATVSGVNGSVFSNYLDVHFLNGALQVGAYFGNDQWDIFTEQTLSLFDINDIFIGSVRVRANVNTSVDQFIGIGSDTLFYRARFENDATNWLSVVLDDLTYVSAATVPAPSSAYLFLLGFIGLFAINSKNINSHSIGRTAQKFT